MYKNSLERFDAGTVSDRNVCMIMLLKNFRAYLTDIGQFNRARALFHDMIRTKHSLRRIVRVDIPKATITALDYDDLGRLIAIAPGNQIQHILRSSTRIFQYMRFTIKFTSEML